MIIIYLYIIMISNEKKYCNICNKRLKLTDIECKCNMFFCKIHKYPEMHDCSFNYIEQQQKLIETNNPKISCIKIGKI